MLHLFTHTLTKIFQEYSGQVAVSVQQHSQQQPGIAPGVRGQQPQLTCRGRLAHEAISEGEMKENNVDSSAVSGECTDSSPLSKRQQRRRKRVTSEWQSLDSQLPWLTIWEERVPVPQWWLPSVSLTPGIGLVCKRKRKLLLIYSVHREGISSNLGQLKPN